MIKPFSNPLTRSRVTRLTCLVLVGFLVTWFAFQELAEQTTIIHIVESADEVSFVEKTGVSQLFHSAFKDLSSVLKAPIDLLEFDIYLQNFRKVKDINTGQSTETRISVDIGGTYTHEIGYGETRKVYGPIDGRNIQSLELEIERSFSPDGQPVEGSYYLLLIKPTILSFVTFFIVAGIPIAYALMLIILNIRDYILFGRQTESKK